MKYDKFNNSHQNHISVEHDRGSISQDKMNNSMFLANNLIYTVHLKVDYLNIKKTHLKKQLGREFQVIKCRKTMGIPGIRSPFGYWKKTSWNCKLRKI